MTPEQQDNYTRTMFLLGGIFPIFLLLAIGVMIVIIVIAIRQSKANKAEEEKTMDELEQIQARIDSEKAQGNSNLDLFQSQVIVLLTQIKSSNEHIEKHMVFFKTLAIIAIMIAAFIEFITVVSMLK